MSKRVSPTEKIRVQAGIADRLPAPTMQSPSQDDLDTGETTWSDQIDSLVRDVTSWTGNRLEPLVLSAATLTSAVASREPLIDSLRDDAVALTGGEALQRILDGGTSPRARHTRAKAPRAR